MIKVSVIIPAYNAEKYIHQCMESLVHQTLQEIEIIVVDDGSKDNTLHLLKDYEIKFPDKIKVLHKENGGQASARNLALTYAQGEYIGFVDSDDWVSLDMYEKMYQKAKEENADIVVCDIVEQFVDKELYHSHTRVTNKLGYANYVLNKIIRCELVEEVFFPQGLWYEDFEYGAKLLMKTDRISIVQEGLYQYNCRDGSTMHNNNAQKNKDIITVLNHISDFAAEKGWEEKYGEELEYLYIEHALYAAIVRLTEQENDEKKEVIDYIRKEVLKRYPLFYKSKYFKEYPLNKRVATFLNAKGFFYIVKFIVNMKKRIKG
ncbi:MAG: glycosyltransferase family 2 protein [Agathobacter sp.]|nr:glycosyltransferase family 2 protein [Agathobacter sp.]